MWTSIWHTKTMLNLSFKFMYLLMLLLMLLPLQHFAAFILAPKQGKPKIWMHINHCLSSVKGIPIQEVQILLCVDAAASDAENLRMWCLASLVDFFWRNFVPKSLEQLCKTNQFTKQRLNNKHSVEKEFFIHTIEIFSNSRMLVKSYRYWLWNWQSKGGNLLSDSLPSRVVRFWALVSFTFVHTCTWQWRHGKWRASSTKITEFCWGI